MTSGSASEPDAPPAAPPRDPQIGRDQLAIVRPAGSAVDAFSSETGGAARPAGAKAGGAYIASAAPGPIAVDVRQCKREVGVRPGRCGTGRRLGVDRGHPRVAHAVHGAADDRKRPRRCRGAGRRSRSRHYAARVAVAGRNVAGGGTRGRKRASAVGPAEPGRRRSSADRAAVPTRGDESCHRRHARGDQRALAGAARGGRRRGRQLAPPRHDPVRG